LQTQDAIVRHLANTLAFQLLQAEGARLKRAPAANRDVEDLTLQCSAGVWKAGPIGKEADAAFALCEQALAIDSNNVRGLTFLGMKALVPALLGVSGDPKGDIERADELLSKALALDPDFPVARVEKGWVRLGQGRDDEAVPEFERALALDPSNPDADSGLGWVHLRLGGFDKSIEYFDKAISMSPYDPGLAFWYAGKMSANFALKPYNQAIEQARQSIAINPNYIFYVHTMLVAALALTHHDAEAREALQHYLALPTTGPKDDRGRVGRTSSPSTGSRLRRASGNMKACGRRGCRKGRRRRIEGPARSCPVYVEDHRNSATLRVPGKG
jgi:tetratricopeptide (TPR) repeat protein